MNSWEKLTDGQLQENCSSTKKTSKMHRQDPSAHRIIEKRRRDRMNTCLTDLSQLIPSAYAKRFQGRGRIEKTEIVEMAIKYLKHLQAHTCSTQSMTEATKKMLEEQVEHYRLGYQEAMSESLRFLTEADDLRSNSGTCMRLVYHLQRHYDKIAQGFSPATCHATNELQGKHDGRYNLPNGLLAIDSRFVPVTISKQHKRYDQELFEKGNSTELNGYSDFQTKGKARQDLRISLGDDQYATLENSMPIQGSDSTATSGKNLIRKTENKNDLYACKNEDFYNFKKTIKERFTAGLEEKSVDGPTDEAITASSLYKLSLPKQQRSPMALNYVTPSCESYSSQTSRKASNDGEMKQLPHLIDYCDSASVHSNICTNRSSQSTSGSSSGYNTDDSKNKTPFPELSPTVLSDNPSESNPTCNSYTASQIPIFALHPKGNFYIPLAIAASSIEPYMPIIDERALTLHPVSIYVRYPNAQLNMLPLQNNKRGVKRNHTHFKYEPQY